MSSVDTPPPQRDDPSHGKLTNGHRSMRSGFSFAKDVDRALIERLIHWQRQRADVSYVTQYGIYGSVNFVLSALCARGLLPARRELFPVNPYPNAEKFVNGPPPLSDAEREAVSLALKKELMIVCTDEEGLNESDRLVVLMLAICLRTGRNPLPMLDLTRDAVDPIHSRS